MIAGTSSGGVATLRIVKTRWQRIRGWLRRRPLKLRVGDVVIVEGKCLVVERGREDGTHVLETPISPRWLRKGERLATPEEFERVCAAEGIGFEDDEG